MQQNEILEEVHKAITGIIASETSIGEVGAKMVATRIVWKYLSRRYRLTRNARGAKVRAWMREERAKVLVPLPEFLG